MPKITNNVVNSPTISWDEIKNYEMNDLKVVEGRDLSKLKNAIVNSGFNFPVAIWADHRYVIDGAGRLLAIRQLVDEGYQIDEIPFFTIHASSKEQAKFLVLQASSQHGIPTQESLEEFTRDLDLSSMLSSINFDGLSGISLEELLKGNGLVETEASEPASDPEEPPDKLVDENSPPETMPGDIYEIGSHRLICGDCLIFDDLSELMGEDKADMVFTDPPYNIDYEGTSKEKLKIKNDSMSNNSFQQFLYDFYTNALAFSKQGAPIYVCHADSAGLNFRQQMVNAGWVLNQCCIWVKSNFSKSFHDYYWQHEPILYGWAPGAAHKTYNDRKQSTVWNFDKPYKTSAMHPTMKPVELIAKALINSSKAGDIVLDCFGGSGSTMVSAEMNGRHSRICEIDPKYVDVIVARMRKVFPMLPIKKNGELIS